MKQFAKYLPTLGVFAAGILHFLLPSLQAYETAHEKTLVGVLIAALIAAYHLPSPNQSSGSSGVGGQNIAKVLLIGCLLLAFGAAPAHAQSARAAASVQNFFGGGVSYNNTGSPSIAGTGFFAKLVNDGTGTYAFTVIDALPNSLKPLTVTTNIGTGVAQKAFTIGKVSVYVPVTAGVSWQGSNVGWSWTGGGLAPIKIKNNWYLVASLRFAKSSVSNGAGYQVIPGIAVAWGK